MINKGEISDITQFSRAVFPPGEIAHAHKHPDMTEIFYIESGHGEIIINGIHHPIEPGTCIVIEPGEAHELRCSENTEMSVIYFGKT